MSVTDTTTKKPKPPAATSASVLNAAIASMSDPGVLDQEIDERRLPTPEQTAADEPEYLGEDMRPIERGTAPAAPGQPPAPAAPARPSADTQPPPPTPAAAAPPAGSPPAATAPAADPFAEYEEIEYDDPDVGEKYMVRAPKSYADKVRNGYARRSIMDRNIGWLGKHRQTIEPLVTNRQFEDVMPIIQRGMGDQEFANYIAAAYMRRINGLPLDVATYQAPPVAQNGQAPAPAPALAPGTRTPGESAPAGALDSASVLSAIDAIPDVDDYTKSAVKAALSPIATAFSQLASTVAQQRQTYDQQQQQVQQAERQRQQRAQLGLAYRRALQQTFPDEFTEQTPSDRYLAVLNYAQTSGIFRTYGESPAAIVIARQAMSNPLGLAGIGRPVAGSVAARTAADVLAEGQALAAAAANGVAAHTTVGAPSGQDNPPPARKLQVPRFVKDKRTGKVRPLSPREIAQWGERHPGVI